MKRTLEEFGGLDALWPAERKLAEEVHTGHTVEISGDVPPEDPPHEVKIRASFLRYLALGGCDACRPAPKGVRVWGAYIHGDETDPRAETKGLDLEGATLPGDMRLIACRLPDAVLLRGTSLPKLYLNRSYLVGGLSAEGLTSAGDVRLECTKMGNALILQGAHVGGDLVCNGAKLAAGGSCWALHADGLTASGGIYLKKVKATDEVRLVGATLDGDLTCDSGEFTAKTSDDALSADRLEAKGSVFLRRTSATGAVRLLGAQVGGDVSCIGTKFRRKLRQPGHAVPSTGSFRADGLQAKGTLYLRDGTCIADSIDLSGAKVGALADHRDCWPPTGGLLLDGFIYGAIQGSAATLDAKSRLTWLALQDPAPFGVDFWPQPYEQLAKVLREMGHREDATRVLVEKEKLQRRARRQRSRWRLNSFRQLAGDGLLKVVAGYGYRPQRAIYWLAGVWAIGLGVFFAASQADAVKPNNAFILRSAEWAYCDPDYTPLTADAAAQSRTADDPDALQRACFREQAEGQWYPVFNAGLYSLDTLLPVVEMEMQQYWVPDETHDAPIGKVARWYLWVHIAAGWFFSLFAVAGFSGLIKSD